MSELEPPFIDKGDGCPTPDSVHQALGMFSLGRLAGVQTSYHGQLGTVAELVGRCKIEQLTHNWPSDFIGAVIGAAAQAGQ